MLRNTSTQALHKRTSHGLSGSVRAMPIRMPRIMAITQAPPATESVQPQACSIHSK